MSVNSAGAASAIPAMTGGKALGGDIFLGAENMACFLRALSDWPGLIMKHNLLVQAIAAALTLSVVPFASADEKAVKEPAAEPTGKGGTVEEYKATGKLMLTQMGKAADILESAKDKDSAKTAAEKLTALNKEFAVSMKKAKAMGKPSAEIDAELNADKELSELAEKVMTRFMGAAAKIQQSPDAAKVLAPALDEFGKLARSLGEEEAKGGEEKDAKVE